MIATTARCSRSFFSHGESLMIKKVPETFFACVLLCGCSISYATKPVPERSALDVVRNGQPRATIIIPDDAVPCVRTAAEELQYHLRESSGATLKIVQESEKPSAAGGSIYLGSCKATSAAGIDATSFAPKTFAIKSAGGNLYLAGRDGDVAWLAHGRRGSKTGTLLAVYEFLDRFLGVRWLWPGKLGEVIPRRTNLRIDSVDLRIRLPIAQSRWLVGGNLTALQGWATEKDFHRFMRDQSIWLRRQRFGWDFSIEMPHSFEDYWKRFSTTHPEYFNLLPDGTRRSDPTYYNGSPKLISMCVSQPALWRQIVEDWKSKRTLALPHGINVSENDTVGRCVCANCLAWDAGQPYSASHATVSVEEAREAFKRRDPQWTDHLGSLSDRYAKFMLAVQKLAEQTDPKAVVMGYAYANRVDPPVATQLNARIYIGFVPQVMYPWTDAKRMLARKQIDGWAKTGAQLKYRPNYMLCGHNMPIFFARKLAEDFSYIFEHGLIGTNFDSLTGQFATQGPNLYVLARLHRNPTRSVEEVLDEYYSAFGPAAPMVRRYFDHWEQVSNAVTDETFKSPQARMRSPEGGHWASFYRLADIVFTPEVMAKGRALLAQAQEAAQGDAIARRRVAFLQKGLRNAELTLATQVAYRAYKKTGAIDPFVAALTELDSYRAAIEGDYVSNMGYLAWLENGRWKRPLVAMLEKGPKDLPDTWKFRWDPQNKGTTENWQAVDFDDSQWLAVGVDDSWQKQAVGKQWAKEHGDAGHDGFVWYRNQFEIPASESAQQYTLGFGAVDEACVIWVNGRKILTRPYPDQGDTDSWQAAFEVDITKQVRFDKPNVLAVRVEDHAGASGISKGVWLATADMPVESGKNLVKNGSFEEGAASWNQHVQAGKFSFTIDDEIAHNGNQSARLQCTETASRADKPHNPNALGRWYQSLPVEQGKIYALRCFVKTSPNFAGRVQILLTGDAKENMRPVGCLNTRGRWLELSIDNYVAAGDKAGVYLNQYGLGKVWFDDVELVEKKVSGTVN